MDRPTLRRARFAAVLLALAALAAAGDRATSNKDPLAAEIERWSTFLKTHDSPNDPDWAQVKAATVPLIDTAQQALQDGRRLWALLRLTAAEGYLAASRYVADRPAAELKSADALESEWKRVGGVLRADLVPPTSSALDGVRPAAVRAVGEAAFPQVKIFYDASLDFARNTMAESGYFYIGSSLGQRDVVALCRKISEPAAGPPPPVRPIGPELDLLEAELLAAYRPPAAIDKHDQFITASGALKESRELDAAGLRYGALLRYLQTVLRSAPLRPAPPPIDAAEVRRRLDAARARMASSGRDDSIGRLFLEVADADIASSAASGKTADAAASIAQDVLPRYFAALEPARPVPPRPAPAVTVTLVRWPYT